MIQNKTKNRLITEFCTICNNFFTRGKGLMFSSPLVERGFVFEFDKEVLGAIHMLFVFFPIDIIWLDNNKKVIEMRQNILPFTPSIIPKKKSRYFIELPAGTIKETNIEIKDHISWNKK